VGEGSLLDWLSVAAVVATATAAGLRAASLSHHRGRYVLLTAILTLLAVDDAAGLHERVTAAIAGSLGVSGRGDALFLVPYLPLLALAFALLWAAAREARPPARTIIRLGLALLVAALVVRVISAFVAATGISVTAWQRTVGLAAMHDAEIAAWVLLASGLAYAATSSALTPSDDNSAPISAM
jgi:hypothetical protein